MSNSTSVAVSYRSLQAIADLRRVAVSASDQTLSRLAAGAGNSVDAPDLRRMMVADGCRLTAEVAKAAHSALLLAATLPDDDYDAFRASTAILIADRLQNGAGDDDLFWHWDAFQSHYRTLPDRDRAAVLQGFRQLQQDGRIALFDPPEGDWMTTETRATVQGALEPLLSSGVAGPISQWASWLLNAHEDASALAQSAIIWTEDAEAVLSADPPYRAALGQGFRHIYETHSAWMPYQGQLFVPSSDLPAMIP